MPSFKIFFKDTEIRRISTSTSSPRPSWDQFHKLLLREYGSLYHPELSIQYVDEEGDYITVTGEAEFSYMLDLFKDTTGPIKIYVKDSPGMSEGQYFKDSKSPEPQLFYTEKNEESLPQNTVLSELADVVPKCLEMLFPGGKILPYNLPSFLKEIVKISPVGSKSVVDLDVNIQKLYSVLHREAMNNFESKDYEMAKVILNSSLTLWPTNPITYYNLACAHALCDEEELALKALRKSIGYGYNDLAHIEKDTDLNSIRASKEYADIIALLHSQIYEEEFAKKSVECEKTMIDSLEKISLGVDKNEEIVEEVVEKVEEEEKVVPVVVGEHSLEERLRIANERAKVLAEEAARALEESRILEEEYQKSQRKATFSKEWGKQLDMLDEMGFGNVDVDVMVALLKKYSGNILLVVEAILASS